MRPEDVPLVHRIFEAGAQDRIFDALLIAGPLVIVLLVLLGRNVVTRAVAVAYLAVFVLHVIHNGLRTP